MKLITNCERCHSEIKIPSFFNDTRIDLAKSKGETFKKECTKCAHINNIHVDDVIAVKTNIIIITAISTSILSIILTILLWDYGYISLITISIPFTLTASAKKYEKNKILQFNMLFYNSRRNKTNKTLFK